MSASSFENDVERLVDHLFRHETDRVIAYLTRAFSGGFNCRPDLELAPGAAHGRRSASRSREEADP
jgi:hypothetical protein